MSSDLQLVEEPEPLRLDVQCACGEWTLSTAPWQVGDIVCSNCADKRHFKSKSARKPKVTYDPLAHHDSTPHGTAVTGRDSTGDYWRSVAPPVDPLRARADRWIEVRPGVLVDQHEPPALFVQRRNARAASIAAEAYTRIAQDKSRIRLATAPIVDVSSKAWVEQLPLGSVFDAAADMVSSFQSVGKRAFSKQTRRPVGLREPDFRAFQTGFRRRIHFPYVSFPPRHREDVTSAVVRIYTSKSQPRMPEAQVQSFVLAHSNDIKCECSKCVDFYGPLSYQRNVPMFGGVSEFGWSKFDELLRGAPIVPLFGTVLRGLPDDWQPIHPSLKYWVQSQQRNDRDPNLKCEQRFQHPHLYRVKAKRDNEHYDREEWEAGIAAPISTRKTYGYPAENKVGSYAAVAPTPSSAEFKYRDQLLDYKMKSDLEECEFELKSLQLGYPPSSVPLTTDEMHNAGVVSQSLLCDDRGNLTPIAASLWLPSRTAPKPYSCFRKYVGVWDDRAKMWQEENEQHTPNYYTFGEDLRTPSCSLVRDDDAQMWYEEDTRTDSEKVVGEWDDVDSLTEVELPSGFAGIKQVSKWKRTAALGYPRRRNQKTPWWRHYWPGSVIIFPLKPDPKVAGEFWAKVRALKIDLGPNPDMNFTMIKTGASARETTGFKDETSRLHKQTAARMQYNFLNLNRKVPQDVVQELMTGRRAYVDVCEQFDVSPEYVRKCAHDAVKLVALYDKAWTAKVEELGIYTLAHFNRAKPRLYRIAASDANKQDICDGFHNLVMNVLEARVEKRRVRRVDALDRAYFDIACEFVRIKPFRVLPEPAEQTPALSATMTIIDILLSSPLSED